MHIFVYVLRRFNIIEMFVYYAIRNSEIMKDGVFASGWVCVPATVYNLWDLTAAKFSCPGGDNDYLLTIYEDKSWLLHPQVETQVHVLEGSCGFFLEKGHQH